MTPAQSGIGDGLAPSMRAIASRPVPMSVPSTWLQGVATVDPGPGRCRSYVGYRTVNVNAQVGTGGVARSAYGSARTPARRRDDDVAVGVLKNRAQRKAKMGLILIIVVLVLLFGGGGGYYGYRRYGGAGLGGALGLILIILLVVWLLGGLHFGRP